VAPSLPRGWKNLVFFVKVELNETRPVLLSVSEGGALIATWLDNAIFFFQVELNETAVTSVLLSQSGDSGALIATWLEKKKMQYFSFRLI
jgi:hypothetical protein